MLEQRWTFLDPQEGDFIANHNVGFSLRVMRRGERLWPCWGLLLITFSANRYQQSTVLSVWVFVVVS